MSKRVFIFNLDTRAAHQLGKLLLRQIEDEDCPPKSKEFAKSLLGCLCFSGVPKKSLVPKSSTPVKKDNGRKSSS